MADNMGWGQTSYESHSILKMPNRDTMAATVLRLLGIIEGPAVIKRPRVTRNSMGTINIFPPPPISAASCSP
jgi:hypothetical protein